MHKFPIYNYSSFNELPFNDLDDQKFLIYILDFKWNYLFVNAFACEMLAKEKNELLGRNMWNVYKELLTDPNFVELKKNTEEKMVCNTTTISPVTGERISITGYPLSDCYYFCVSILPKKDMLLDDLRNELNKQKRNRH